MEFMSSLEFWLWAAAVLLAALYFPVGLMKAFRPIEALPFPWSAQYPGLTRFVGYSEIAGGLGLVIPLLVGVLPWLTPLAALGLSVIQVLAIGFHARRGETAQSLPLNLVLLALSLFVLWGRFGLFGG